MADGLLMKLFQVLSKGMVLRMGSKGGVTWFYRMRV